MHGGTSVVNTTSVATPHNISSLIISLGTIYQHRYSIELVLNTPAPY